MTENKTNTESQESQDVKEPEDIKIVSETKAKTPSKSSYDGVEVIEVPAVGNSPLNDSPIMKREYTKAESNVEDIESTHVEDDSKKESTSSDEKPKESNAKVEKTADDVLGDYNFADTDRVDPMKISNISNDEETEENKDSDDGGQSGQYPIADKTSKDAAKKTAGWIMDMYQSIYPEVLHQYSKVNEDDAEISEAKGNLIKGSTNKIRIINVNNKEKLIINSDYRNMIERPLRDSLEVSKLSVSPPFMLLITAVFVSVILFITARSIKNENMRIIEKLINDNNKSENK